MTTTRSIHKEDVNRQWFIVDAKDQIVGRLCSNIAKILRGKHKPTFTLNVDAGDFVIVLNADKIKLSGKKADTKVYRHYTGYPGGLKSEKFSNLINTNPQKIIFNAVRGMLPHSKLGRAMIKKLKVYAGTNHPHSAQNPSLIKITKG